MMYRFFALSLGVVHVFAASAAHGQAPGRDTLRLALADAVVMGLRAGDEVRLADAQADIADAQLNNARAALVPQLRISSAYTRTLESARSNAVSAVFNQPNTYSLNGNLSQTIFEGGRLVNTARAASSAAEASHLTAEEQRALFTVAIQRAYLGAQLATRLAELQDTNLALATTRLAQVQQFEQAGRAAQYDVLRARVERANLEPLAIQARNDRELAYLELKRLLNLPLDQPLALTTTVDTAAAQALFATYASTADSVTRVDRAAIRSAELVARSRRLGVAAARADFMPTITAFFQSGFQAFPPRGYGFPSRRGFVNVVPCDPSAPPTQVCRQQNGGWFEDRSFGLQFSWPLFDYFRIRSAIELARAQTSIAELQLRQTREQVAVEVARANAELHRAKAVFDATRENQSEAQEAFRLASLRFSRGLSTQLEVSDAQLALLTAQSGGARATYDLYLAAAELARALGRPIPTPADPDAATRPAGN